MTRPNFDTARLRKLADEIIALENQKDDISSEIKQFYDSAKEAGYKPAVLRKAIALQRKPNPEAEELLDLYRSAIDPQRELFQPEAETNA